MGRLEEEEELVKEGSVRERAGAWSVYVMFMLVFVFGTMMRFDAAMMDSR